MVEFDEIKDLFNPDAAMIACSWPPTPALSVVLGWQPGVGAMTQCLAEAGRAGSSPQPVAEQAWLCAGQLKRSFMTSPSTVSASAPAQAALCGGCGVT